MEVYIWLSALILCLVVEGATMGTLVAIWFVPGALVALTMALLQLPLWSQILAFVVLSGTFLVLAGTIFRRFFYRREKSRTNLDRIIGEKCRVTEEINNLTPSGAVKIGAVVWTARAVNETDVIPVGSIVRVQAIEGVKVLVLPEEKSA
jgi:membrane protein implicated in regulation of membrane protease activity